MTINGIDTDALSSFAQTVAENPAAGNVKFEVETNWKGGTQSTTHARAWEIAGEAKVNDFVIEADEPEELLGSGTAPNPQELLMAALNACMVVGYVATAATMGVNVRSLSIKTTGELDLRGFLALDPAVSPGYENLDYQVTIEGDGSKEQYEAIHENVIKTSPNRWNIANAIKLNGTLVHN